MQSYIVRVYNRNPDNMNDISGVIVKVGTQRKYVFLDFTDLQESLAQVIKLDDSENTNYSAAKQIDMYGMISYP
jgi:carbohydrate-selective porin OprB